MQAHRKLIRKIANGLLYSFKLRYLKRKNGVSKSRWLIILPFHLISERRNAYLSCCVCNMGFLRRIASGLMSCIIESIQRIREVRAL